MADFFTIVAIIIATNAFICLYRAAMGPTIQDRVLAVNIVGTKTLVVVVLVTFIRGSHYFLDVAMVYALLLFVVTVSISRWLETTRLEESRDDR